MVGPVPGADGLFVAAGHEGSGLTLAPGTAELVCAQLLGCPPALSSGAIDSLQVPYKSTCSSGSDSSSGGSSSGSGSKSSAAEAVKH